MDYSSRRSEYGEAIKAKTHGELFASLVCVTPHFTPRDDVKGDAVQSGYQKKAFSTGEMSSTRIILESRRIKRKPCGICLFVLVVGTGSKEEKNNSKHCPKLEEGE